jgi:hypothetical protein
MINGRAKGPEVEMRPKRKAEVEGRDKRKAEVEARWKEFWHDHKDFESTWGRKVLNMLSEFLPFVFKFNAVPHGLEQLYARSEVNCPSDFLDSWTDAWEWLPSAALRQLPIFRLDLALRAYAYYGLKLRVEDPPEVHGPEVHGVDEFLEGWEFSYNLFPREWCGEEEKETITAALARVKLDHPSQYDTMTPDELAALARVSRKSIMNLLAPSNRSLLSVDQKGQTTIGIESARRWLSDRSDYRPSVWKYQEDMVDQPVHSGTLSCADPIFVPVASDDVWFSPDHRSQRKDQKSVHTEGQRRTQADHSFYYVANGDHEERYEDYWQALDFLNRAESPRWRYSDAGQWRSKNANSWIRKSRQEIEALLDAGDNNG